MFLKLVERRKKIEISHNLYDLILVAKHQSLLATLSADVKELQANKVRVHLYYQVNAWLLMMK